MKKQLLGLMTILTVLGACQKNEVSVELSEAVTIHATIDEADATKTVMDESNNILWSENDQIIAFLKSSFGHKYQLKPSFIGKSYAEFSMILSSAGNDLFAGNEWEHNVAYYPYSEDIECLKSGANYELEVNLPSEQVYVPDSFANGSMAMVAVSENNNITFKNILGGIKLQFKGTQTVKSIKIEGNNNEKLSGAATVIAYTDETKPAITMAQSASTSVILNCGSGVQLSESTATEFIIALPPVLFSQGFSVTVTDYDSQTYTVETDKANTVLRSSLLVMPMIKLGSNPSDNESGNDDELIIPVSYVNITPSNIDLYVGDKTTFTATVGPRDATYQTITWSSSDNSIATVDQYGLVNAISMGAVEIFAEAGGVIGKATVVILPASIASIEYIDEYGINHGKGTAIGRAVWAPVNCGYHATDYTYGKLYQWGRKYGQGYSGKYYYSYYGSEVGETSDATVPSIEYGGVSVISGNIEKNSNIYYAYYTDWVDPRDDKLWNSGTESNPIKTEYDPCPTGWRVPTYAELEELALNARLVTGSENVQSGFWVYGPNNDYSSPKIFLPAAGYRGYSETWANDTARYRGAIGHYWTSKTKSDKAYYLSFSVTSGGYPSMYYHGDNRTHGFSVRCVQE